MSEIAVGDRQNAMWFIVLQIRSKLSLDKKLSTRWWWCSVYALSWL